MIRKCFKLNTCFIEALKNSAAVQTIDQKWMIGNPHRPSNFTSLSFNPTSINTTSNGGSAPAFTGSLTIPKSNFNRNDENAAESLGEKDTIISETPVKTQLFEVKGPNDSAFLIEVQAKDLEEVKQELLALKGEHFRFDKTVLEGFTIKCTLRVDTPFFYNSKRDQVRLSKVHAITSGCDEVYSGEGKFFFVSSVDRMIRVKRILQKFGYVVLEILYRFQPKKKVCLDDEIKEVCHEFVKAVERLPKVISVTHNV